MQKNLEFNIIALAAHGIGISGGDRIWIELSRRWNKKFPITVHTWQEGLQMASRQNLNKTKNLKFIIYNLGIFCELGFLICYFSRIIKGLHLGLTLKINNSKYTYIYNASEFWMDALPCVILKIRYPKIKWIATWYQTAPNPLVGFTSGDRKNTYKLSALVYWLVQLPIKPLVKKYADKVIVNNEDEKKQFPHLTKNDNTIVLIGAVDTLKIKNWKDKNKNNNKVYDAVFQGRFHPQKGVGELVEIWKKVVDKLPNSKLAMVGDGPLMERVTTKISEYKLNKNITLFGYVFDGDKKYEIFSKSKIVVHPAFYDSGGMASAEAMAFGLPAIGFNLPAYKSYYPKGMNTVKSGDLGSFANAIIDLLSNDKKRKLLGDEAATMIKNNYSWDKWSEEILKKDMQLKKIPFSYMWILEKSMGNPRTVLDLGTADGALMKVLSEGHKWNITGIDIYTKWLKLAKNEKVYKTLIKGDLNVESKKLIRKKEKYDLVFCSQTIEHISRKNGEELLELSEKLAKKRIVFGTPRGYMEQPEEFLGENPYQRHKSGWTVDDFKARGYKVYGIGFAPVWSEEGLARTENKILFYIYTLISFLFAPLVYYIPSLGSGILCIKDINN